jgi:hypothetical protein
MPKLMSIEDFKQLQEESRRSLRVRTQTNTRIIIGLGTCGRRCSAS